MTEGRSLDTVLGNWINAQRQLARSLLNSQSSLDEAIRGGQAERIEAEAQAQAESLRTMESGRQALAAILRQAGYSNDATGLQSAIDAADERLRPLLQQAWVALRRELAQIRDNNRRNSLLAGQHQKAITRSLQILSGQGQAQPAGYDPKGNQAAANLSRYIGIA